MASDVLQTKENYSVRAISAAQARPLRHSVLRPSQPPEACVYEGDEDPTSAHFGVVGSGNVVGVASLYQQSECGEDPFAWRIRGMANAEEIRGQGYGVALVDACVRYATDRGGLRLWCNGRTSVVGFYRRCGFEIKGEEFEIPHLGPHFILEREL